MAATVIASTGEREESRAGGKDEKRVKVNVNRPANTRWKQQKLPKWEPMLTIEWTIGLSLFFGATSLALGVAIIALSNDLEEYQIIYDAGSDTNLGNHRGASEIQDDGYVTNLTNCLLDTPGMANSFHADHTCYVTFNLKKDVVAPVHIYYQLHGYYQSHRRYMSSMDRTQWVDQWRPGTALPLCPPLERIVSEACHIGNCNETKMDRQLFPCGIVANTMFNDIIWLHEAKLPNGDTLGVKDMVTTGIARTYLSYNSKNPSFDVSLDDLLPVWNNPNMSRIIPSPTGDRTPHITPDYTNSTAWVEEPTDLGLENEHWRVWVELAATQPFRKAYGRILRDLPNGTNLTFAVQSNFYVRSFEGTKALVVARTTWFGSRNHALGVLYLIVGGVFSLASMFFVFRRFTRPRPLADPVVLAWKHKQH